MEVSPFSLGDRIGKISNWTAKRSFFVVFFCFFCFFFAVLKTRQCDSAVVVPFFEGIKPRGLRELKSKKAV